MQKETDLLKQLKDEDDALDQSLALNKIVMKLLQDRAADCKRLWIALIVSILVNLALVAGFLWYESQWEYESTSTTTTITQEADGDSDINNVQGNQYTDQSTHNEGSD